jgi:hypothetical protein
VRASRYVASGVPNARSTRTVVPDASTTRWPPADAPTESPAERRYTLTWSSEDAAGPNREAN